MKSHSNARAEKSSTQHAPYVTSPIINVSASVNLKLNNITNWHQFHIMCTYFFKHWYYSFSAILYFTKTNFFYNTNMNYFKNNDK